MRKFRKGFFKDSLKLVSKSMFLKEIEVENFRQLKGVFRCSETLNIIFGRNGQGKTSWIEAIYVLTTGTSFRASRIQETISFDAEAANLCGKVLHGSEIERSVQVFIEQKRKLFFVNGKKVSTQSYLEELHAIILNADQLQIVRGLPEARRKFLDLSIVAIYPAYYKILSNYNRCIKQKNFLLEEAQKFSRAEIAERIEPWNQQIVELANKIHKARVRYVGLLNEMLEKRLFGEEEVSIRYVSSLEGKGDLSNYKSLLKERLDLRLEAEIAAGHSLIGVHRDDLEIKINGWDVKKYGSGGQQRSVLFLLLLANLTIYQAQTGRYPIFLIDDIDAELDYNRLGSLLEFLAGKCQIFVTTSKESFVERFGFKGKVFIVEDGKIFDPSNKAAGF